MRALPALRRCALPYCECRKIGYCQRPFQRWTPAGWPGGELLDLLVVMDGRYYPVISLYVAGLFSVAPATDR